MENNINKVVGRNIRTLRTHMNISQSKLSTMLGISIPTMSLYEKGERSVPLEILISLSRIFNISVDALLSISTFDKREEYKVFFEHFKLNSNGYVTAGETVVSNPYSMYFTVEDINGDTLLFLRTNEATEGVMLVSESSIPNKSSQIDIDELKTKKLFLTTIGVFSNDRDNKLTYTYIDKGNTPLVLKNKQKFIYYGYLVARISHSVKTEEFFHLINK